MVHRPDDVDSHPLRVHDGGAAVDQALRAARASGTRLLVTNADEPARSILDQLGIARVLATRPAGGT